MPADDRHLHAVEICAVRDRPDAVEVDCPQLFAARAIEPGQLTAGGAPTVEGDEDASALGGKNGAAELASRGDRNRPRRSTQDQLLLFERERVLPRGEVDARKQIG